MEVLREWEASFNAMLKHPDGIKLFEDFLMSEFSEENIQFWKACESYKTVPDRQVERGQPFSIRNTWPHKLLRW